jgi:FkbM family methyltransferase
MRADRVPLRVRRLLRRLAGRGNDTVDDRAAQVQRLERALVKAKKKVRSAGGETGAVSEPWVLLDYERAPVKIVASAYKRHASVAKEPYTVEWLERSLRPGDVLFDIGANVGAYALVAAVAVPAAQVFAFEPGFETYAALCRNIALNEVGDRVTALPVALGPEAGLVSFNYQRLGAGEAQHHIGDGAPFDPVFTQRLLGLRLDDLGPLLGLPEPTHVKLDVDGAEPAVLAGGTQVLSSPKLRELQVECEPGDDAVERALAQHGFQVARRYETPRVVNLQFTRGRR